VLTVLAKPSSRPNIVIWYSENEMSSWRTTVCADSVRETLAVTFLHGPPSSGRAALLKLFWWQYSI
jgi:hypothetical protein